MNESLQHRIILFMLIITTLASAVASEEVSNKDDEDKDFLCKPSTPTSIIKFLLVNYVAHCATIVTPPGSKPSSLLTVTIGAFLFPALGSDMAWSAIVRHARLKRGSQLRRAARAGAFCMVVRKDDWKAAPGDYLDLKALGVARIEVDEQTVPLREIDPSIENESDHSESDTSTDEEATQLPSSLATYTYHLKSIPLLDEPLLGWYNTNILRNTVHGSSVIPAGYELRVVPSDALVVSCTESTDQSTSSTVVKPQVSSIYNISKSVIGIIQVVYAGYTLHKTRGHQIEQYGYAAFGLTVTQYLVMSILNLIAQAVNPTYPAMYMVRTPEMDEAERRGGMFDGVIGRLISDNELENGDRHAKILDINDSVINSGRALLWNRFGDEAQAKNVRLRHIEPGGANYSLPTCTPFKVLASRRTFRKSRNYENEWERLLELLPLLFCTVSIVIIGATSSGFSKGQSTVSQRAWTMSWLLSGYAINLLLHFETVLQGNTGDAIAVVVFALSLAAVIGGFVVVIQMLIAYGDCIMWG